MEQFIREGRVAIPPSGNVPRYKRFLDESKGLPVGSVWDDISPINSQAKESLGYPLRNHFHCLSASSIRAATRTTLCWMPSADAGLRSLPRKISVANGSA